MFKANLKVMNNKYRNKKRLDIHIIVVFIKKTLMSIQVIF